MGLADDDDVLASTELERRLGTDAIDEHIALVEEQLHARAAYAIELSGEEVVEARACGFKGHGESARVSHGRPWYLGPWHARPRQLHLHGAVLRWRARARICAREASVHRQARKPMRRVAVRRVRPEAQSRALRGRGRTL